MPSTKLHGSKFEPVISVILINKNERGVAVTLKLLAQQHLKEIFETIVVDSSAGALNYIYDKFPNLICIDFVSKTQKRITIPEQRNVGVRAAHGSVIVFIDAGCEPGSNWLQTLTAPITHGRESISAGGTLSSGGRTFHDVVYNAQARQKYIDQAPTINLAIKRNVFHCIGYFDESLRYGSDLDFTWRARQAGFKIRNVPKALITHDWGDLRSELKRADHYGQAKVILYRKHRTSFKAFAKREFALLFYVGFVVFLPLTFWFPLYPLLILVPILKNLRTNPIKIVPVNFMTAYGAVKEFIHL